MLNMRKEQPKSREYGSAMRFVIPNLSDPNAHSKAVRQAVGHRAAAVRQEWREHNERIRPFLTPSLQQLQETTLHDGLIQWLRIDAFQGTLQLCLLCDDRQGYFDLKLDYKNIRLAPQETSSLCLIAYAGGEVSHDEIDLSPRNEDVTNIHSDGYSPAFIHRISWHTKIVTIQVLNAG